MNRLIRLSLLVLVASSFVLAGCAKKAAQAPPTPPEAPPATSSETTPPAPPPAPPPSPPAPPTAAEVIGTLQPAFFEFDSYSLDERARLALDADARILRENPSVSVVIEGHCDERGTAEYNQALGERRAMAAREYLVAAGINASRLRVISFGKERPFASGGDEGSWAQNRRAHFTGS